MLNLPDAPVDGTVFPLAKCDLVWNAAPQGRWRRQSIYQLSSLDPAFVNTYGSGHTITLNGSGFTATCEVMFDGALIAATFVSSKRLTITVPGSNVWKRFDVWVVDPVKGATAKLPFEYRDSLALYMVAPGGAATNTAQTFSAFGGGYTPNSVIHLDGVAIPTTYVSGWELIGQAPISATIKTVPCTVVEAGQTTAAKDFRYIAPLPPITLTMIQPGSTTTNDHSHSCTMTGTGFTADCVVQWGTTLNAYPSITSATEMNMVMPVSTTVQTVQVYVKGIGRQSNAVAFSYTSVTAPVLTILNPDSILAGGQSHLINVQGSNFDADAKVWFDGAWVPCTWVASTRLDITVTAPIVGTSRTFPVKVENPDTAEQSNEVSFSWTATQMVPEVHGLIPNYMVVIFSGEWEVVVQSTTGGMGSFTGDAVCYIDGVAQRTTFYSPGTLRFWCTGADWPLNETTGYPFTVVQAGGTSAPIPFYNIS